MSPSQLLSTLQSIRSRVKRRVIAYGVGLTVAAAVGMLLALVFCDWALALPVAARAAGIVAIATALCVAVRQWILQPAFVRLSLSDVAGRIEHAYPQFDDRLRSTVDFLNSNIPGSDALKQRVVDETSRTAAEVNFQKVVRSAPVWEALTAGIGALAVLAALILFVNPLYVRTALARLALQNEPWPKSVQIAMEGPVPRRVPVGERIPIRLKLVKGDRSSRKAMIEYRYGDGPWQQEVMTRADGMYSAYLDARLDAGQTSGKISVRVSAGDDQRDLAPIAVTPRLEASAVEAEILPPPYVHPRRSSSVNLTERPAVLGVGSEVALRFTFNKPLAPDRPIELRPAASAPGEKLPASVSQIVWERPADNVAVARLQAVEPMRFGVSAADVDGFENTAGAEYELIVREDQMPSVQIEEPRRSEERTPDAEFDVKAVAEDDYGIDNVQLVVHRLGEKKNSAQNDWTVDLVKNGNVTAGVAWELTDSTPERQRYHMVYHWALASLAGADLQPGDMLEYFLQVKDNFDLNGKQHDWAPSGKLRITIISHDQWDKTVRDVFTQTFEAVKEVYQQQVRNKQETDTLAQGVAQKKTFDDADTAQAQRLTNQQSGSTAQTAQIADRLSQLLQKMNENKSGDGDLKQTAIDVQHQLDTTAEGPMRQAATLLDHAAENQPAKPQDRAGDLQQSSANQQHSAEQLKSAMDRLGNFGGLSEAIANFQDIRDLQNKLAKGFAEQMKNAVGQKPEEMSPADQEKAKNLSAEQSALSRRTASALDELRKTADRTAKSDPTASEGMRNAADAGQQQQVPGKQTEAADSMSQNQQAQAQAQHAEIDLGLEQILDRLKEAQRLKLEELSRQLAAISKLIAELIARQSGHNIDNLLLQGGPPRLTKLDAQDLAALFEESGRDPKALAVPAGIDSLSASQEQTERNARDIAKQAEQLPDPTPGAKLTAAAGQMERAIVHLRDNKLPDAYDPPQVQALATLVEAQKAVDEALRKAMEQLKQENQETIRTAYLKLLEGQKKIGSEVIAIDQSPKDAAGQLPRMQAIRLGQLPGEQAKLSDDAVAIGKKLESLGSVVFVWANKDIVQSMGELRDDLAKPETGAATQVEEHRIEVEIQSMIDSLATKKNQSEFASRQGGGGSGSSAPRMPGEAELRLQKALQLAVNDATIALSKMPQKDVPKLAALGERQGALRGVFNDLLEKATHVSLGPEPDNRDQLPEEASKEDVEDQEFDKQLRNDDLTTDTVEKGVKLTGDRMARSRQRLALNSDPGQVTQEIQKHIISDLDLMIQLAQQQQQQGKPKPGSQQGEQQMAGPKEGNSQQQMAAAPRNGAQTPAGDTQHQNSVSQSTNVPADLSKDIQESMKEWGGITARQRQAVQEGAGEKVIEKYKRFVEDYYRSLSEEATKP